MKIKKILIAVLAAANVVSAASWIALTAVGSSMAKKQSYNYAADIWDPDGGYTQISCFFPDNSGFTTDVAKNIKNSFLSELKNLAIVPEDGKEIIPEAYSTSAGQMSIKSDKTTGRSEAIVTAVGGDFFRFRDFDLLDGCYFSDKDIMQDGAIIDRELAWNLYGSTNVAGLNIYVNGTKFYISGVIDDPLTEPDDSDEKDDEEMTSPTTESYPRAYISYAGAALISDASAAPPDTMTDDFADDPLKKVSCYECLIPDPVEGFAYEMAKKTFEGSYNGKLVCNSTRFTPSVRAKALKNITDYVVSDEGIIYPYWENSSRMTEFKLSFIYFFRRFTYVFPAITLLIVIMILWKAGGRLWKKITDKISDSVTRLFYNHSLRKAEKKESAHINKKG